MTKRTLAHLGLLVFVLVVRPLSTACADEEIGANDVGVTQLVQLILQDVSVYVENKLPACNFCFPTYARDKCALLLKAIHYTKFKTDGDTRMIARHLTALFPTSGEGKRRLCCMKMRFTTSGEDKRTVDRSVSSLVSNDRPHASRAPVFPNAPKVEDSLHAVSRLLGSWHHRSGLFGPVYPTPNGLLSPSHPWPNLLSPDTVSNDPHKPHRFRSHYRPGSPLQKCVEWFGTDIQRELVSNFVSSGDGIVVEVSVYDMTMESSLSTPYPVVISSRTERQIPIAIKDVSQECAQSNCAAKVDIISDQSISERNIVGAIEKIRTEDNFTNVFDPERPEFKVTKRSDHEFVVIMPFNEEYVENNSA